MEVQRFAGHVKDAARLIQPTDGSTPDAEQMDMALKTLAHAGNTWESACHEMLSGAALHAAVAITAKIHKFIGEYKKRHKI